MMLRRGKPKFAGDFFDGAAGLIDGQACQRGIEWELGI